MTSIILYQVLNSNGIVTNQWLSTDNDANYYEPGFGSLAWTEQVPILNDDKTSVIGADGFPTYSEVQRPATFTVKATDITGTKLDPRMLALRSKRDALLSGTKWIQERHLDELALNLPTTVSATTYTLWLQYWQALRALPDTSSDLDSISWPAQPPIKG